MFLLKDGSQEQYVRIADVDTTTISLYYNGQDYSRRRIIATLEQALQYTFQGSVFTPEGKNPNVTDTFATQVADAAKFYGTKAIDKDALAGNTLIEVDNIFQQLVPSSKQQVPIINADAVGSSRIVVYDEAVSSYRVQTYKNAFAGEFVEFGQPIVPGSITWDGATDTNGLLIKDGVTVGTVNYLDGVMTVTSGRLNSTLYYRPGVILDTYTQFTEGVRITLENQGLVFIKNVSPVPDPQSTYVDYRANGKWYRVRGNADGSIGNAADGLGAGLIVDNGDGTATITVTLGAVPEIDSTVIFAWGSDDIINDAVEEFKSNAMWGEIQLDPFINPDDFSIYIGYWGASSSSSNYMTNSNSTTVDGITFENTTLNSNERYVLNTTEGVLRIYAKEGRSLEGRVLSTSATTDYYGVRKTYTYGIAEDLAADKVLEVNPTYSETTPGVFTLDSSNTVQKSSVRLTITVKQSKSGIRTDPWNDSESITVQADVDGILRDASNTAWGQVANDGTITVEVPSITGEFLEERTGSFGFRYYVKVPGTRLKYNVIDIGQLEYYADTVRTYPSSKVDEFQSNLTITYKIATPAYIVNDFILGLGTNKPSYTSTGNSFKLIVKGNNVYSRLYKDVIVGSFDRVAGLIEFSPEVLPGEIFSTSNDFSPYMTPDILYTLDPREKYYSLRHVFKVGSGDIVNSSLILRYRTASGTHVATSNADGVITGTDIDSGVSYVDPITGAVSVEFTSPAIPSSIVYDCVAETVLPLDPELLGLNPVRLPSDGRVPIFFPGAFVVVFNEDETDIGTPLANDTVTLARNKQSYIEVVDVNGQRLDYNQYVVDRVVGSVTFNSDLALVDRQGDALTPPLRIIDRVEDMGLCTEASVNGRVSISSPLSRDYTAGNSYIASALVWGDIGARIFNLFSQQTFDQWSDEQTQSGIPAQFDNVNYPIQINNKDSFTGRWAFVFTSSNTVDVISETLGTILEDVSIDSDISPINPATGNPYFTIPAGGWGGGWVTSNVFRFNTTSGAENMWVIRSVQSGALTEQTDSIDIEIRGDVN